LERVPGVRISPGSETNILAFATLQRAAVLYPDLFSWATRRKVELVRVWTREVES
jgi:hypothetical protein